MAFDLSRSLKHCECVAFDFETTGLSAARERVVEIGAVRFLPGGKSLGSFSRLVQPGMQIPELVVGIHGITDQDVAEAPDFRSLAEEVLAFFAEGVLLAHHAAFDLAFLTCELRRADIDPPPMLVLDTYHLARLVFPAAPSYKLSALVAQLNLTMSGPAHRALPDAEACARLFEACLMALPEGVEITLAELIGRYPQARVGVPEASAEATLAQRSLQLAIRDQQDVVIQYRNARNEVLDRRISPILLGGYGRYSYVEAFCHLRQANRQFRIDRIQQVSAEIA